MEKKPKRFFDQPILPEMEEPQSASLPRCSLDLDDLIVDSSVVGGRPRSKTFEEVLSPRDMPVSFRQLSD